MNNDHDELWFAHTMGAISHMKKGNRIRLTDGWAIAMGEDFSIGWVLDGGESIAGDLTFRELFNEVKKHEVKKHKVAIVPIK